MRVHMARSLSEALDLKAGVADIVPIAGGTDLLVHWPSAHALHERAWLDLSGIAELRGVHFESDAVVLGALATYWDVITEPRCSALPLLPRAALTVGAVQIQTRGTWAGNIANASPAADGVPALMAYDATVELASTRGRRSVALSNFYLGYKKMVIEADELIVAIRVPIRTHDFEDFVKVGSRAAQAITKVGVAVAHSAAGWRVVANSMAPTVCRCPTIEARLDSTLPLDSPADLAEAIGQDVAPIDDIRSNAVYRERVFARILYHALHPATEATSSPESLL